MKSKINQYSIVRIEAFKDSSIDRDGWSFNKRPPDVGDTGTVVDILKAKGHSDRYVVED